MPAISEKVGGELRVIDQNVMAAMHTDDASQ
jgi:hypothetical protein